LFVIAVVAALLPLFAEAKKPAITLPTIHVDPAIVFKHPESPTVRRCTDGNKPFMLYKSKAEDVWYIVCQIQEDGEWKDKWSIRAIIKDLGAWHERTAFIPKDGSWLRAIQQYLEGFATRWRQPLP
jgi:hypothetical protein